MIATFQKGKVILVGAGSGDPELLTVKGMRCLQQADVILTDRLVSPAIIEFYASPQAQVIYVGKQCRKGASTPQATINELMVLYAQDNKRVVRLKGGDVSIFSNVLDELETLVQYQIPYEIVPGITAALGAAAYAGMPLTARNYATAVRLLTAYKSDVVSEDYWRELAQTDDTLVFYMSSETVAHVVKQLTKYGISAEKKLAIIEQATTPYQQVYTTSLYQFAQNLGDRKFLSPSLVVIGKVVDLHAQFQWLPV
ncbi:MAG TPA: uroporphyrinogen-III C-methyltransferase, partial [Flavisolibacter sp.]